jgi:hypothetical protein
MTEPAWYDPDYDDPADPPPVDVESARRWMMLPVIAMRPPFDAWWCPTCRYLVPDAVGSHPSRATRPARIEDCTNQRYRSVFVAHR